MTFLYLIAVKVKGHMLTFSARSFFWRENREWTCFKPSLSMEFKCPSLKVRKREHPTPVFQDLPSFEWANLKEEIGRGSFGSVFVAKYARTSKEGGSGYLVVIKKLLGTEEQDKGLFLKEAKILQGLNHKNVVQFQAICNERSAIMLEYLCFDFPLFGTSLTSLAAGMLNQIWHGAEEIISHHKIIDLGEGVYCVTEPGNSVNVVFKGVSVTCR